MMKSADMYAKDKAMAMGKPKPASPMMSPRRKTMQERRAARMAAMGARRMGRSMPRTQMAKGGIVKANCGASMTPANVSKGK
jgi:hypothetical protein